MPSCLFLADRPYPRRIRLDIGSDSRPVWLAVSLTDAELYKCSSRWKRGRQKYEARSTHQVFFVSKINNNLRKLFSQLSAKCPPGKAKTEFSNTRYTWPSFHQFHKSLDYIDFPQRILLPLLQQKTPRDLSSSDQALL